MLARVAWGHEHFLPARTVRKHVRLGANTYAGPCVLARVAHEDRSAQAQASQAAQAEIALLRLTQRSGCAKISGASGKTPMKSMG